MRNSNAPQVNAGSMADIAFLLLIFFFVSAKIPDDRGFYRELPPECTNGNCNDPISEANLLRVNLNANKDILIEDEIVTLNEVKDMVKNFADNNASKTCSYCEGKRIPSLSEHPTKAIISLKTHPKTSYKLFIQIQDEFEKAYHELRLNYADKILNKTKDELNTEDIKTLNKVYPLVISETNK